MSAQIKNRGSLQEILKGSLIATLLSILFVLVFALLARLFSLSSNIIPIINQVIKVVSVFLAVMLAVKTPSAGYIKGMAIGLGFVILSTLIFCLLGGEFNIGGILIDLAIACVVGLISGIIAVNRKNNKMSLQPSQKIVYLQ